MHRTLAPLLDAANSILLGHRAQVRLAVCCLLARGHLLIEDLPGVGKTLLAHALAHLLGLDYQRIQFTSDLLPADILGASIYETATGAFRFQSGPIFHQLILADEINRATPRAQSALLEAKEERHVTVEGRTRRLPEPFFVIATQNPQHQVGTFPLPESQLDRFLMRLELGYPDPLSERALLAGADRHLMLQQLAPCSAPDAFLVLQAEASRVHVADALLDYLQALIAFSREAGEYEWGLSPRAGLALLNAARAWACLDGRDAVLPEDVQAVLGPVCAHRLRPATAGRGTAATVVAPLLDAVPVPA